MDLALPPREQRHRFLRYEGLEYTNSDIADFESRMAMEHRDEAGVVVFTSQAWGGCLFQLGGARRRLSWRQFILSLGLHTEEEMESPSFARDPILRLCHRMMAHSIAGRSQAPKKVTVTDLFYLRGLDVGSVNIPYLLARYLRRFAAGKKSGAHISGGQFVARLAEHFELLTAKILRGLTVIAPELQIIDMAELPHVVEIARAFAGYATWVTTGLRQMMDMAG
ncbi:hypothetical protein Tco_1528891, partial [Tanacetum coccineum]